MPKNKVAMDPIGNQYGRPDIERLGLFVEMPYMNGKKYTSPYPKLPKGGGRNIMGEGRKTKNGTQHGYFDQEFRRLFEGEGIRWKKQKEQKEKPRGGMPFLPAGEGKWHSTPGDYYGCFSGNIEAFGTGRKPLKVGIKVPKVSPNMRIGATKMGGCGYADIGLSPYPEHLPDPFFPKKKGKDKGRIGIRSYIPTHFPQPYFDPNPFMDDSGKIGSTYIRPKTIKSLQRGIWIPTGPAKWEGGCKGGTFSAFPEHIPCKYIPLSDLDRPRKHKPGANFYPQSMAPKTLWHFSTLNRKTDIDIHPDNYKHFEPTFTKYLVN